MADFNQSDLKKNKAFCVIPWLHLHVMPDSSVIPCCVSPYEDHYGNVSTTDIEEIWNNEKFKKLRSQMLKGELPAGCSHCHDLEKAGFLSMREKLNKRFSKDIPEIVLNTSEDGIYNELKLKYIDIRFSNLCNLKCRGCGPPLSSSWFDDYYKFYGKKADGPKVKSISADSPGFWKVFQDKLLDAQEIYFGGGEPLITKEHFDVLRLLIAKGKTDVHLSYNTNLSTLTYGNHNLVDLWGHFKSVTLGISIDDLGERAEYFRSGTKWKVFENNLFNLRDNYKGIRLYMNCTVNITNIFYLPELYTYLYNENIMDSESFNINLLLGPEEYRIDAIPMESKIIIKKKLEAFLPYLVEKGLLKVKDDFQNTIDHMMKTDNSALHAKFLKTTQKMDDIRGESFVKTYPALAAVLNIKKLDGDASLQLSSESVLNTKSAILPNDIKLAVYDHHHYFKTEDAQTNLHVRTLPCLDSLEYKIIGEWQWDEFLHEVEAENSKFAVIIAAGLYINGKDQFVHKLVEACEELKHKGWPLMGHILDFNNNQLLPYIHEQFIIVNIEVWKNLGRIPLGSLFTNQDEHISGIEVSGEHLHSNYTPTYVQKGDSGTRSGKLAWGSQLIQEALRNNLGVLNISRPLWNIFRYAYPRDESPEPKDEINKLIGAKKSESKKLSKSSSEINLLSLNRFSPNRAVILGGYDEVDKILDGYESIHEVISDRNILVGSKISFRQERWSENGIKKILLELAPNEKCLIVADSDKDNDYSSFAHSLATILGLRVFQLEDSKSLLLGKGLDFIKVVFLDHKDLHTKFSKLHIKEIK